MAKVLRIAAVVVAVAAAIPTGGTSLFGAALASAGVSVSAATAATIASAVAISASTAAQLLTKRPSIQGGQTDWQSDLNAPIPIVFGRTLVGGQIIYRKTGQNRVGGVKNYWQFIGSVLSGCGPVHSIDATYVDAVLKTFTSDNIDGAPLHDHLYQRTQLGATPESAALIPTGPWAGTLPGWSSDHKLSGYAAVMNGFVFDGKGDNVFTQVPRIQWLMRGVRCYDPRQDSTYSGGSGSQRWDDESTWAFSENGWIQALTFAIGWHHGPNNIRVGGVGMPITSLDLPAFVEAANVADANGWKSGGRVVSTDDKWQVLKSLCQAGGGEPVRLGATLSCIVNTPRISIGTITRDDVIGNVSITTTQTRRDRVNGIIPQYRSEDHLFEQVTADLVRNSTYLTQDGGVERTKEVVYAMVQTEAGEQPAQAAQLAAYDIANGREAGPAVLPLKLRWLGYRAGDCLTIEDTPEFGYLAGKKVIVMRRQLDPENGSVVLTVREETEGKHTWALSQTGVAAPMTDGNAAPDPEAPESGSWTVTPRVETTGASRNGIIAVTGAVDDDGAPSISIEYRVAGASDWINAATLSVNATSYEITGLDPAFDYDVAVSYFPGHRLTFSAVDFGALDPTGYDTLLIANSYSLDATITGHDAGSSASITINSHTRTYSDVTRSITGATLTGLSFGTTYSIYYDDGARAGGAVAFQTTTVQEDAFASPTNPARHNVGVITTPADGAADTTGYITLPPGWNYYYPL